MAGGLKPLLRLLPVMAMAGVAGPGYGQGGATLVDPTRPPALVEPAPEGAATTTTQSGLQAVILREGRKPIAVINGVQVELGGKLGDATLVKLNESEAVLQGPAGRETLWLTPGVGKTSATNSRINLQHRDLRKPGNNGERGDKQAAPPPDPTQ